MRTECVMHTRTRDSSGAEATWTAVSVYPLAHRSQQNVFVLCELLGIVQFYDVQGCSMHSQSRFGSVNSCHDYGYSKHASAIQGSTSKDICRTASPPDECTVTRSSLLIEPRKELPPDLSPVNSLQILVESASRERDGRTKRSRFTEEQIIGVQREQEEGAGTTEVCRKHGISQTTFFKWKAKYGRLNVSDARKLNALEDENPKLKKLLAEAMLDNAMLKDIAAKKW
jgi:putative transposase